MAQTFEQVGLNHILTSGLENQAVSVVALASSVVKATTNVSFGTVSGSTVNMGQAVLTINETGITIDEIQIRIGNDVVWKNTGLSFAFPSEGTLTIDASFTLSSTALTAAGRTALLKHGLSAKNGQLTTLGGSPIFQNFTYQAAVSNNVLDIYNPPVTFNMPAGYNFTGLSIAVTFPPATGTVTFGSVSQNETFTNAGTLTVSSLATSLTNN
jgi:hypothetical protein